MISSAVLTAESVDRMVCRSAELFRRQDSNRSSRGEAPSSAICWFFFSLWVGEEGGWEMRMAVEGGGGCSRDEIYVEDFGEV